MDAPDSLTVTQKMEPRPSFFRKSRTSVSVSRDAVPFPIAMARTPNFVIRAFSVFSDPEMSFRGWNG